MHHPRRVGGGRRNASPFGQIMPCAGSGPARLVVTHRGRIHRLGYAASGFGRPQRCWRSLRMRARSRRWAASTPGGLRDDGQGQPSVPTRRPGSGGVWRLGAARSWSGGRPGRPSARLTGLAAGFGVRGPPWFLSSTDGAWRVETWRLSLWRPYRNTMTRAAGKPGPKRNTVMLPGSAEAGFLLCRVWGEWGWGAELRVRSGEWVYGI
jgi:hypothetical protein